MRHRDRSSGTKRSGKGLAVTHSNDLTPHEILDLLRDDATLSPDAREAWLSRLVERFPAEILVATIQSRFSNLSGEDAEAINGDCT